MGRRKFKLGRIRKNEERKRQASKMNKIGRPPKHRKDIKTIEILRENCSLPSQWVDQSTGDSANFCKIAQHNSDIGPEITCSITVEADFSWKVHVYGKEVSVQSCCALRNISCEMDVSSLNHLLTVLDRSKICVGHPDKNFVSMLKSRKGEIKTADGEQSAYLDQSMTVAMDGESYSETVRSAKCELITNGVKCSECVNYRSNLRSLYQRWQKISSPSRKRKRSEVDSHANYRYLNTPEKRMRLANLRNKTRALHRQVDHLKLRIKKLTEVNGVCLDKDVDADMRTIMNEHNDSICASHSPQSFEYIFWKQQQESMQLKDARQMRWHPMMIKWCMNLRMLSSSCYDALRSTGVLKLPSERTLRDYTHIVKSKPGLQQDVDEQLVKEAKLEEIPDHQKYVALIFDEVKIKEDLVYNKHSGELIGFVDISDVHEHLTALEQSCLETADSSPKLATHMLVFMIRGLFSSLEFPYAQFPVASASGEVIFPIVWHCIEHLEMIGFKVLAVVCDGASPNRKFFKMHGTCSDKLTYKVKNIYADGDRPIFFISDVPHLLKTTRNSWANSYAHSNSRKLWVRMMVGLQLECMLMYGHVTVYVPYKIMVMYRALFIIST